MKFKELVESRYNSTEASIPYATDKFKLIDLLENKFKETDSKFLDECERLIYNTCAKTKYNAFVAGFKQGIEYKKSLHQ